MTKRIILITGGAGFIGSNIAAELTRDASFDVVICDRLRAASLGKWRNLAKHPIANIFGPEEVWPWLERRGSEVELIVHMGAVSSTQEADADTIVNTNFGLSRDLFCWCAAHDCRFIYASSAATYGDGALGFDDVQDVEFLANLRPLNAYGWSKAFFDCFAVRQAGRGRAPPQWVGLKFFNVYGPNEGHKGVMASMARQMWPHVAAGRAVKLYRSYRPAWADGGQERDFVHVGDAARAVAWLVANPKVSGLFNLGSGEARSFNDLAEALFKAAGREPRIDYIDMPPTLRDAYQYVTQAKMERLRAAGYDGTATGLEEGVADYVQGYLSGPDPYR
jgi:ADP-L-glycero-D-manno-heptose 6-epimerase